MTAPTKPWPTKPWPTEAPAKASWSAALGAACLLALLLCWSYYPDQVATIATAVAEWTVETAGWISDQMHPPS